MSSYSVKEEIANSIIHGVGALLSVIGLTILLVFACLSASGTHFVSYLIYGLSLTLLYLSSTLYHALPQAKAKRIFKICDHACIYLLIAGTYTPFLVLNFKNWTGYLLLIAIWSLALLGVLFKIFYSGRFRLVSTLIYLAMGWMIVLASESLKEAVSSTSLVWLISGGVTYSVGSLFYLMKSVPFHHAIWHLFVLLASIFHYVAVVFATLPLF